MRTFFMITLAVSVQATTSFADLSGDWKGSGKAWDTDGFKTECQEIQMVIVQTAEELALKSIRWDCKDAGNNYSDLRYQIKGQELYKDGKQVGALTPNGFKVGSDAIDIPITFEATGQTDGSLLYHEEWKGSDSVFQVEGLLKK